MGPIRAKYRDEPKYEKEKNAKDGYCAENEIAPVVENSPKFSADKVKHSLDILSSDHSIKDFFQSARLDKYFMNVDILTR